MHGAIQTYVGAYDHPLSPTKHAFFVLCMCRGHPNIWEYLNIWGCPSIQEASKHRGHPNIQGHSSISMCPNIQGGIWGAFKHMGAPKHMGHLNVWGHMGTPFIWQSILSLCCVSTEGIQTYRGHNIFLYNPELYSQSWISAFLFFFFSF